ncbi:hypothetical protein RCL_jg16611.t1 [Rhizophagus clarus]|uniref:Uncharacterized protein n=1 Tax=Rhizophagus clarus TaxID=94130 RepID=A0A8H3LHY5_9GLOM|nr:hypothetical protein RCL_jg16611.t1 [Rhizophagus clarus]
MIFRRGGPGFRRSGTRSRPKVRKKWTELFRRSGTLIRSGPVFRRSGTPIRSGPGYFEGQNSLSKRTMIFEGPELPLAAGHDIRRSGLSFAADHKGLDLPIRSGPGPDLRLSDTVHGFLEAS